MQADFFGKRGISWHLTVCQSKQRGELVAQTSVHIVESGLQDNHIVYYLMVCNLKKNCGVFTYKSNERAFVSKERVL